MHGKTRGLSSAWPAQSSNSPLSNGSPAPGVSAAHHRLARHSQLGRAQLDEYASRVMALDEEGESFVQKIHRLFTEAGALRTALLLSWELFVGKHCTVTG